MIEYLMKPNLNLVNLLIIPMFLIETILKTYFFTLILNIQADKYKNWVYILSQLLIGLLLKHVIPEPFSSILCAICSFIFVKLIYKTDIVKSILATGIQAFITVPIEMLIVAFYTNYFHITLETLNVIPLYRISILLVIYFILYLLYLGLRFLKINIRIVENISKRTKTLLFINILLALSYCFLQVYIFIKYLSDFPIVITLLSFLALFTYLFMSIYTIFNATKLAITEIDLEKSQSYNKTLTILHDNIRTFKHDFNNIVQAIGGYIHLKDMDGLKNYHSSLLENCQRVNNLTSLNPEVINNPPIYGILTDKYHKADEKGIKINLEIFLDLNTINMKIYEFTKVLGILMDNAIEAAEECEEKIINLIIRKDANTNRQLLIVENTYQDKDIDLDKIYEKSYTTKENNSGIGLWDIRHNILKKNKNLNLHTTKNDTYFMQQLEIY